MNKHILLLCYAFPPYPGVGGRRWAKFAKFLARDGYTVHVICAKNIFPYESYFTQDILNEPNIHVYPFSPFFPSSLELPTTTLSQKIRYNFWLRVLPFIVKGYIFDRAILSKKRILRIAGRIIRQHGIKNVIASGAPFHLNYYALSIKEKFPSVNVINDFRDPWIWAMSYSYGKMSKRKQRYETFIQQEVITRSDLITVPVDSMYDFLVKANPSVSSHIVKLPHAFDPDETVEKTKYSRDSFRLVFYGTLYQKIGAYLETIAKHIASNKGKITLDIISDGKRYNDIFEKHHASAWVNYHAPITGKELFQKLSSYDYVLFLHPDYGVNNISTKFYEVIYSRIPILYVGEEGAASAFIRETNVGIHFTGETLERHLQELIDGQIQFNYNRDYDVTDYNFSSVTRKLENLFIF